MFARGESVAVDAVTVLVAKKKIGQVRLRLLIVVRNL